MNKKIGVFLPARLTSERLPRKLILPIGETCLFDIACQKINSMPEDINRYVLIYDTELGEIAARYSNIQIIWRSKDSVEAEGPLSFIFRDLETVIDSHLMFLNPCLLFLKRETICNAIYQFQQSEADYATSVKLLQNWIIEKNGKAINEIDYKRLSTKEIKPLYQTAHCFHIFHKNMFFEDGYMLKNGFLPLLIPNDETIDVDTQEDYEFAKWKYEKESRGVCL